MVQTQRGNTCSPRTGQTETGTLLTPAWALRTCRYAISLLQEAAAAQGASLRGTAKNLTHCTGHLHRRTLATSPSGGGMGHTQRRAPGTSHSRGLGGRGSYPLWHQAAPSPSWSRGQLHQCYPGMRQTRTPGTSVGLTRSVVEGGRQAKDRQTDRQTDRGACCAVLALRPGP